MGLLTSPLSANYNTHMTATFNPPEPTTPDSADFSSNDLRHDRMRTLVEARTTGTSLPAPFYVSNEAFQLDVEAVFGKEWIFVGSVAEIREPGDYFTINFGTYSVIVLRDDDEQVRAMHNVCRHRGARVLDEERGSVGNIVCGYHQWTYSTAGALLHAPAASKDFDPTCFGLRQVACHVVAGLVFISLAKEPNSDFGEVAKIVAPYISPHQLERTKVAAQIDIIEEGNWKLVVENNRECYHCGGHPELGHAAFPTYGFDPDEIPPYLQAAFDSYVAAQSALEARCDRLGLLHAEEEQLDTRRAGFRIQREALDGPGESFSMTGGAVVVKPLADFKEKALGRLTVHTQPNAWFHFLGDHAVTFSALPVSANRTLVRSTWLVHEDAQEVVDYDLDELTFVWAATNAQDAAFVARAHAGIASPAYVEGPYLPSEYQVEAFVNWYITRLREHFAE